MAPQYGSLTEFANDPANQVPLDDTSIGRPALVVCRDEAGNIFMAGVQGVIEGFTVDEHLYPIVYVHNQEQCWVPEPDYAFANPDTLTPVSIDSNLIGQDIVYAYVGNDTTITVPDQSTQGKVTGLKKVVNRFVTLSGYRHRLVYGDFLIDAQRWAPWAMRLSHTV